MEEQQKRPSTLRRRIAAAVLVLSAVGGAAIVFLPIGWQINRFTVWLYYFNMKVFGITFISIDGYDFLLNILLFAIPASAAAVLWPKLQWWAWALAGAAFSGGVELIQYLYLPRLADWGDVLANTLGAALGPLLVPTYDVLRARFRAFLDARAGQ